MQEMTKKIPKSVFGTRTDLLIPEMIKHHIDPVDGLGYFLGMGCQTEGNVA